MDGQYLIIEKINVLSLVNALVNNGANTLDVKLRARSSKNTTYVFTLIIDTVKNKRHRKEIEFSGHEKITGASFTAVAYNDDASGSFGMFSTKLPK